MGVGKESVVSSRLKREDCKRTKHDSVFSDWKVLIGPSDWEDHSTGKEGAERYRVHNLPNCSSCSGLYELGIAVPCSRSGRETSKLDPDSIIPVYLGQADNVRTRLQRYGREGAHLENGKSFSELNDSVQQGLGLFSEIFSRGCSVVYRWAPMKNKRDAVKTEAQLLDTFDYAWNKGNNGFRRPNDILQKLGRSTSSNTRFPAIARKILTFYGKKKGIRIEACKPNPFENVSSTYSDRDNNDLFSRILKIGRSQPRLVSVRCGFDEDHASICGVAIGHGSICRKLPVEGRKRCAEHKGMKLNGFVSKLIPEGKSPNYEASVESDIITDPECEDYWAPSFRYDTEKPQPIADNFPVGKDLFPTCGVTFNDGTLCRRPPVQGRKRCKEHKGRKVARSLSESGTGGKQHYVRGLVLESSSSETGKSHKLHSPVLLKRPVINKTETICGVDLKDGTLCERRPVVGRMRCEEHKGMRVTKSKV